MLKKFALSLGLFIKLISDFVCSQNAYYILNIYQKKNFSIFEMDSLLVNNQIECLRKCSLKQACIFIKYNQSNCTLYGDEYIHLDTFFIKTRRKYLKVDYDLNKKVFNGTALVNPENCHDWYKYGQKNSKGIYTIFPDGKNETSAYCEMNSAGYTVIFRKLARITGESFNRNWIDFKNGFGNLTESYWIGLENIYYMTTRKNMNLIIEIIDVNNTVLNITYATFFLSPEINYYKMNLGRKLSGNSALLDIRSNHNGKNFTTKDKDNDNNGGNCASLYKGGWWFTSCYAFCLTCEGTVGQYKPTGCNSNACYLFSESLKMSIIPSIL